MQVIDQLALDTLALLKPPKVVTYSEWAEENFVLAEESSAKSGRFRLWAPQREPLNCMGDPDIERVTFVKAARVGFTKMLMAGMSATQALSPCNAILLLPTDQDVRDFAVREVDPAFEQSPALRPLVRPSPSGGRGRFNLKMLAGGGSIAILAARSPRNLRARDAKQLWCDEVDAMQVTTEGDPIKLAEQRTRAHFDRKIVIGSTPTVEGISIVDRLYRESDQRVYEVPCPRCKKRFEILFEHIVWPPGEPDKAACVCPHCYRKAYGERKIDGNLHKDRPQVLIEERFKSEMIASGKWRAERPEVKGHAGFRINTFISLLPKARWGILAAEYLEAKRGGPATLQVFVNTVEGRVWKSSIDAVAPDALRARAEPFGLIAKDGRNIFPADALGVVFGVDTQPSRFEVTTLAFDETRDWVVAHEVVWGSPREAETKNALLALLSRRFTHPNGWTFGYEAGLIDSGGHNTEDVYDFCAPLLARRIYPIVGRGGVRRELERSKDKRLRVPLHIVGVDQVKGAVLERLAKDPYDAKGNPVAGALHISKELPEDWADQATGERRFVRYVRNVPITEFRPTRQGQPVEALDCLVYAMAAKHLVRINFNERREWRGDQQKKKRTLSDLRRLNRGD